MDIAAASMALSSANLINQVSTAMLDKALDNSEELTSGLIQMIDSAAMEQSVNPHLGSNLDIRI